MSKQEISKKIRTRHRAATTTDTASGDDAGLSDERDTGQRQADRQELDEEDIDEPDTEAWPVGASTATSSADQSDREDAPGCPAKDVKKWRAWIMQAAGMSQKDIASDLKVTTRTIRNWLKEFDGKPLGLIESLDPKREVEKHLLRLKMRENKYREYQKEAEARSDLGVAIRCERLIERLDDGRNRYLARIGLFDRLNLSQLAITDSGNQQAGSVVDMIEELLASVIDVPDDDSSEDE